MADRNQLAQEVKQLKADQEERAAAWKEAQSQLMMERLELMALLL